VCKRTHNLSFVDPYLLRFQKDTEIRVYSSIFSELCSVNMDCALNALIEVSPAKAPFTAARTGAW
jgi:hypothetical protein